MARRYIPKRVRAIVFARGKGCCEYCKFLHKYVNGSFVVEHIKPVALGGTDKLDNLAYACSACNSYKNAFIKAIDSETGELVPLFHPRQHLWSDHFVWSKDALRIVGLTPIGRATIDRLKTNREGLIFFRKLLIKSGEHPPDV